MSDTAIIDVLKALADPTRLGIVRQLYDEGNGTPCSKVSNCYSLSQPAMSHHLSKLTDAGIVKAYKSGKEKVYELDVRRLAACGIDASKL